MLSSSFKTGIIVYDYGIFNRDGNRMRGFCTVKPLIFPAGYKYDLTDSFISKQMPDDGTIFFDVRIMDWKDDRFMLKEVA